MIPILQDIYMAVMKPFIKPSNKLNQRTKNILMISCFLLIVLVFCFARIMRRNDYHNYFSLAGCVFLFFIAVLSLEEELKPIQWSKPITYSWISLCLIMIASDFKVTKVFSMIGYIFLFVFSTVFFVWNNSSKKDILWGNFVAAVRISFLVITFLSFLFRPRIENFRYPGTFINPNMFGLYLIFVFVIYLIYLDDRIQKKSSILRCIGLFVEMGFGAFLLFMTQARTSFMAVAVAGAVWFFIRTHQYRKEKKIIFFAKYILVLGCTVILCFPVAYQLLQTLPNLINHPITYEKDQYYALGEMYEYGVVAKAAELTQETLSTNVVSTQEPTEQETIETDNTNPFSRFISSLQGASLDQISSNRLSIYKRYMAKLNLSGHEKLSIKMDGVTIPHAHNNLLQFGFSYGYLAMIPYGLLNLFAFVRSIQYFRKKDGKSVYAFLPMGIVIAFSVATLAEAIFLPFQCFPGFVYWFIIGALLPKELGR